MTQTELEERVFNIDDARDFKIRPMVRVQNTVIDCVSFNEDFKQPRDCVNFRYPLIK
jgi:hypothetical protein